VRIITGVYRGRTLRVPKDRRVRPTSDRVREAWFSILGETIRDARVLDLCAGSGALGLEALSRGAAAVDFVERARPPLRALRSNIDALGVQSQTRVHETDALRFVLGLTRGEYDVALADPPYATELAKDVVAAFRSTPFARILSVEHHVSVQIDGDDTRTYGDMALTFVRAHE